MPIIPIKFIWYGLRKRAGRCPDRYGKKRIWHQEKLVANFVLDIDLFVRKGYLKRINI